MADHPSNLTHNEVRDLMIAVATANADSLTDAAVCIRAHPNVLFSAGVVADLLTSLSAVMVSSAERHFQKEGES